MSEWTKIVPEGISPTGFAVWFRSDVLELIVTCPSCSEKPYAQLYRDWDTATVWVCHGCSTVWSLPEVSAATPILSISDLVNFALDPNPTRLIINNFWSLADSAEKWIADWTGWNGWDLSLDISEK